MKKKIILGIIAAVLVVAAVAAVVYFAFFRTSDMEDFTGDLRGRYDYNLNEYIDAGDYKDLTVNVGPAEPTKDEIEARIMEYRVLYTATEKSWDSVGEGVAAELGNIVDVRYQGYLDGEELRDVTHPYYKDEEGFSMTLGGDMVLPGMDEHLIGMKIGEKKTFEITVPDPCFKFPYYVGETIKIEAEIVNIRGAELEPYDADFAAYYGSDSIDGFEAYVISELKKKRADSLRDYVLDRVMAEVFENFEVIKYPEKELGEVRKALEENDKQSAKEADLSFEEYVQKNFNMTMDEYGRELEAYAKDRVRMDMVMYYIARNEQLALTNAEFDERATILAQEQELYTPADYVQFMMSSGYSEYDVRESIWFDMVYDFMYENTVQKES